MKTYIIKSNEINEEVEIIELNTNDNHLINKWIDINEGYFDNFTLFTEKIFKKLMDYRVKDIKKVNLKQTTKKKNYYDYSEV